MTGFVLRRFGESLLAVWGVVTIIFFVTRILGDPAALLLPIGASDADIQALRVQLGLDRPILVQYGHFIFNAVQGDFGTSFQHGRDAMQVVLQRLPATLQLGSVAIVLGVIIGSIAGSIAALQRGRVAELLVMTLALLGQATPIFWLGIMLILFFAVNLGWLPTGGYGTTSHIILPAVTLAVFVSASIARLLRSSMLEIFNEDYIRTAKAKGLLRRTVFVWHIARNALIPVVTMTAILAGELLGGSVVTETVFAWPGIGRLIIQAVEVKDFPVVQAGIAVIATIFVLINFLVDLLYGAIDPRIRLTR